MTLTQNAGRWLAVAMLADESDIGTGDDPRTTLRVALAAVGEPRATEKAASAELVGLKEGHGAGDREEEATAPAPSLRAATPVRWEP